MQRIYLDYNATTPVLPGVMGAMQPFLVEHFGNPSSDHTLGRACSEAICDAREQLASLIGADADELIFTGGGSESNNLAIKGVFLHSGAFCQGHLVISAIEHPATSVPAEYLRKLGVDVTVVPCDADGVVDPDAVRKAIRANTRLVSIMLANNEVGSIQPIADIAAICHERDVMVHTDAAQAVGKIPVDVNELDVDMLSIAGHKLYAPKGIGALYIRETVDMEPLIHGASHERGLRAGTENTPYIVGLGRAAKLASARLQENGYDCHMRDQLLSALLELIGSNLHVNGEPKECLPNTLSVSFPRVSGRDLLARATEVCASTGAACHSNGVKVSATLAAMHVSHEIARGTVRLSTGVFTTYSEIDQAAASLAEAWRQLGT